MKPVAYVRWADASYSNKWQEVKYSELTGTVELHEVGFLVRDVAGEDTIALSLEHQEGTETSRNWLIIPRVNILEMRVMDLEKAFPKRRKKS